MMKNKFFYIIGLMSLMMTFTSCEKYLDINTSPNTAERVDPKLLFSFATTSYINLRSSGDFYIPIALAGQSIATGGNNPTGWGIPSEEQYVISSFSSGNTWRSIYTSVGTNLKLAITQAEAATPKNNNAAAQCKVLLALAMYDLSTIFGDVPFTEAFRTDIQYPKFDEQKVVLEGIVALLDEALAQFDSNSPLKIGANNDGYDMFYGGDIAKWKKLANSAKLRTLMTMVDKDPTKTTAIGTLINSPAGTFISSASDNFRVNYQDIQNKRNPKFAIGEQYNGGLNFFFASSYITDFLVPLDDPRLPRMFDKPAAAATYIGVVPGEDASDNVHPRLAKTLHSATAPEVIFTFQEQLFYEAEVFARGLGVTSNLTTATTRYRSAVEESAKFFGVTATAASTYAATLPSLATFATNREAVKYIHYHHWVDKMDRGLDAFTQWRRSGIDGDEVPALTLPVGAPSGPLFRRYEYPITNEISLNPNAPKELIMLTQKMWFDL
jgi:hypothetical protein